MHDLAKIVVGSVRRILPTFCLWFLIILVFAIMGHHIDGGRVLVNEHGQVDMEGRPNRFNFGDIYHSLVFIFLDSFDEEWDYLMFREYLGVNPVIVGFQMLTMLVCYLLFSKYLVGSFANEIDLAFKKAGSQEEEEEEEQEQCSMSDIETINLPNQVAPVESESNQEAEQNQPESCLELKARLLLMLNTKLFLTLKVMVVFSVCITLAYFTPKVQPSQTEAAVLKAISIFSFAFFLVEAMLNILVYGLVGGKHTYLRRDHMNILSLALLVVELLYLTPLSENATFHSLSKVRALRILFVIQLVYQRSLEMKLIVQAISTSMPFMIVLITGVLSFFVWACVVMVRIYKDDEYYCDNAFRPVETKQECFESGGDWIKEKLNFASVPSVVFFGSIFSTMEGWLYKVIALMDANGKDKAPQYNANEHIQIFFVVLYLGAGIIVLNFMYSIMLINYKRKRQ